MTFDAAVARDLARRRSERTVKYHVDLRFIDLQVLGTMGNISAGSFGN